MISIRSFLVLALLTVGTPLSALANGKLTINVAPFESEVELKEKIRKQLEGGGMEWGLTGNRLVVTMVNKQFVGPTINQLTRFGTNTSIDLPAGDYQISCVGMVYEGGLSVTKVLSKGGYFNENVMAFHVAEGKTTTLDVRPMIRKSSGMLLKVFMPEYIARSTLELDMSAEVSLNSRSDKSVAWDDYNGDLKFKK